MDTILLNKNEILKATKILKNGGIVAIPTETVYGLAACAFDEKAILNIFKAKGRPSDNPLIVHISNFNQLKQIISDFPEKAKLLAKKFWPGPLTMVLPKNQGIPDAVTAGLNTVAVRFPSHKTALEIISKTGPLVAPSANSSGTPSPTCAEHVISDLNGKIDAIVDGENCEIGLESTIVSFAEETPTLLRPGAITYEMLTSVLGEVKISNAVKHKLRKDEKALSPGLKYKHYSPKAKVIIIEGENFANFLNSRNEKNIAALCFDEDIPNLHTPYISLGKRKDYEKQAKSLFSALRTADEKGVKIVYARCPKKEGIGLAIYNRLIRAAGFEQLKIDNS